MNHTQENKNISLSKLKQTKKESRHDTKRMAKLVIELNALRKNILMYPKGHKIVETSVNQAYGRFKEFFILMSEITFGVAKNTLLVDEKCLDPQNSGCSEFALTLSQFDIASITFSKGLGKGELLQFLDLLSNKPEDIRAAGSMEKVVLNNYISHIKVQCIDFGKFHFTEEKEIVRPQVVNEKEIWQDFIIHLLSETFLTSENGLDITDTAQMDPVKLAHLMNEQKLDPHSAIKSYQMIISDHLQDVSVKKGEMYEKSPILEKFNTLVKELKPELKQQFLSVTFKQCSSLDTDDFIGYFPDDMVIEMISQANQEGREISPSLLMFVQKLSNVQEKDEKPDDSLKEKSSEMSKEQFQKLFKREKIEDFIDSDYGSMLKNLTETPEINSIKDKERFPIEEYMATMNEDHIDVQIARVLHAYMNKKMKDDEYEVFSRELISTLDIHLEKGEFQFLQTIFKTISKHRIKKKDKNIKRLAERSLMSFEHPKFIGKVIHVLESSSGKKRQEVFNFLVALGSRIIPTVLNHYIAKDDPEEEDILFKLLIHFKQRTINVVKKRLKDPDVQIVRNLLKLVSRIENQGDVSYLKRLLYHYDLNVRLDTLGALIRLKDPWAIILLRKALWSKQPLANSQAISLAGDYQITDVIQDLILKIKRVAFSRSDYELNEQIITALGRIGDPRAIPILEKLARTSLTFHPKSLLHMKTVLFESLDNYPSESISNLINIGSKSGDETIRGICEKLMNNKKRDLTKGGEYGRV